jgi:hypothetical protein
LGKVGLGWHIQKRRDWIGEKEIVIVVVRGKQGWRSEAGV